MQATQAFSLREFGSEPGDLSVDFVTMAHPLLATRVIAACAGVEEDAVWNLTVGERLRLLLAITAIQTGGEFTVELSCSRCQTISEIDLAASKLLDQQPPPPATLPVEVEQCEILLRLPTGFDQMTWLTWKTESERDAVLFALGSLVVDSGSRKCDRAFLEGLLDAAERSLECADPLVDYRISTECPDCGAPLIESIDWTQFAFRRFRDAQRGLVDKVHRLASRYHWSEAEIFAVPVWRRDLYLAAIEREAN